MTGWNVLDLGSKTNAKVLAVLMVAILTVSAALVFVSNSEATIDYKEGGSITYHLGSEVYEVDATGTVSDSKADNYAYNISGSGARTSTADSETSVKLNTYFGIKSTEYNPEFWTGWGEVYLYESNNSTKGMWNFVGPKVAVSWDNVQITATRNGSSGDLTVSLPAGCTIHDSNATTFTIASGNTSATVSVDYAADIHKVFGGWTYHGQPDTMVYPGDTVAWTVEDLDAKWIVPDLYTKTSIAVTNIQNGTGELASVVTPYADWAVGNNDPRAGYTYNYTEKTVSQINGISTPSSGATYTVKGSPGELTIGPRIYVIAGDVVRWDGSKWVKDHDGMFSSIYHLDGTKTYSLGSSSVLPTGTYRTADPYHLYTYNSRDGRIEYKAVINTTSASSASGNVVIDNITFDTSNTNTHGGSTAGVMSANGHRMILGTNISTLMYEKSNGYAGQIDKIAKAPNIMGSGGGTAAVEKGKVAILNDGEDTTVTVNLGSFVIIHSGVYNNVISSGLGTLGSSDIPLSSYAVFKDCLVLDTIGSAGNAGIIYGHINGGTEYKDGGAFTYIIGAFTAGDFWQDEESGYADYVSGRGPDGNINGNTRQYSLNMQSSVAQGGSTSGYLHGSSHLIIAGDSSVWDCMGGGRDGSSTTDYSYVEITGRAEVRRVACGITTDGAANDRDLVVDGLRIHVSDDALVASIYGGGFDTWSYPSGRSMSHGKIVIDITGGRIGDVYGGGYRGTIGNSSNTSALEIEISISGDTHIEGNVYGGGSGGLNKMKHAAATGKAKIGNTDMNVVKGHGYQTDKGVEGNKKSTGRSYVYGNISVEVTGGTIDGDVYGGGMSVPKLLFYSNIINFNPGPGGNSPFEAEFDNSKPIETATVVGDVSVTIGGDAKVRGSVYGAGKGIKLDANGEVDETEYGFNKVVYRDGADRTIGRQYWVVGGESLSNRTYDDSIDYTNFAQIKGNVTVIIENESWYHDQTPIIGSSYTVSASDADANKFIVLHRGSELPTKYDVVLVDSEGNATVTQVESGGTVGDAQHSLNGWKVKNRTITEGHTYTVMPEDADGSRTIVLFHPDFSTDKYTVLMIDDGAVKVAEDESVNAQVPLDTSHIDGSVYGGGGFSKLFGSTMVNINSGNVGVNVFGGGLGLAGKTSIEGNRIVYIQNNASIGGSVYGGSEVGVDGQKISDEELDSKDADTINKVKQKLHANRAGVIIQGGYIKGSVFGGGLMGKTYGNTALYIGYYLPNLSVRTPVPVNYGDRTGVQISVDSVFAGGNISSTGKDDTSIVGAYQENLVMGSGFISIHGNENKSVKIPGSIMGSGNACKTRGETQIEIDNLFNASPMAGIHRATKVTVDRSNINIVGRSTVTEIFNQVKTAAIFHIDELVLKGGTSISFGTPMDDIKTLKSQTADGSYTTDKSPLNRLVYTGGSTVYIRYADAVGNPVYGNVDGFTLMVSTQGEYGAYAMGNTSGSGGFSINKDGSTAEADTSVSNDICCWYVSGISKKISTMYLQLADDSRNLAKIETYTTINKFQTDTSIMFTGGVFTKMSNDPNGDAYTFVRPGAESMDDEPSQLALALAYQKADGQGTIQLYDPTSRYMAIDDGVQANHQATFFKKDGMESDIDGVNKNRSLVSVPLAYSNGAKTAAGPMNIYMCLSGKPIDSTSYVGYLTLVFQEIKQVNYEAVGPDGTIINTPRYLVANTTELRVDIYIYGSPTSDSADTFSVEIKTDVNDGYRDGSASTLIPQTYSMAELNLARVDIVGAGSGSMPDASLGPSGSIYKIPENGYIAPTGKTFSQWKITSGNSEHSAKPAQFLYVTDSGTKAYIIDGYDTAANVNNIVSPKSGITYEVTTSGTVGSEGVSAGDVVRYTTSWAKVDKADVQIADKKMAIEPVWKDILNVVFDRNDGTGAMTSVPIGRDTEYVLPEADSIVAPANQKFAYWSVTIGDGRAMSRHPGETITIDGDTVIKAIWSPNVLVGFDPGQHGTGTLSVSAGDIVSYGGSTWAKTSVTTKTVAEINELSPSVNNTYRVSGSGTLTPGTLDVVDGNVVRFNGTEWEMAEKTVLEINGLTPSTGETYCVTDSGHLNNGIMGSVLVPSGQRYTLPMNNFTPSSGDYKFGSWTVTIKDSSGSTPGGTRHPGESIRIPDNAVTVLLTAQWVDKRTMSAVTFAPNGGTAMIDRDKAVDDIISNVDGWYVKGRLANQAYTVVASSTPQTYVKDVKLNESVVFHVDRFNNVYNAGGTRVSTVLYTDPECMDPYHVGTDIGATTVYTEGYKIAAGDDYDKKFVVAYKLPSEAGKYTVIIVPTTGSPTIDRNLSVDANIYLPSGTWVDKNGISHSDSYTVHSDDAINGFIVLYESGYNLDHITVIHVAMVTDKVADGTKYRLQECPIAAPAGRTFSGWSVSVGGGSPAIYQPGAILTVTGSASVTALWSTQYVIGFANGGGTGEMPDQHMPYEGEYIIPYPDSFSKTNNKFVRWSSTDGYYYPGQTITVTGNMLLTAMWEPTEPQIFRVSFDPMDGSGYMPMLEKESGAKYTLPDCEYTRSDRVFLMWLVTPSAGAPSTLYPGDTITITGDTILRAIWAAKYGSAENVYVVIYIGADGSDTGFVRSQHPGDKVDLPSGTYHSKSGTECSGKYTVNGNDADSLGYIVLYKTAVAETKYTVATIVGFTVYVTRNAGVGDAVELHTNDPLYCKKVLVPRDAQGKYRVNADDAISSNYRYIIQNTGNHTEFIFKAGDGTGSMPDSSTLRSNSRYVLPESGFAAPAGEVFDHWEIRSNNARIDGNPGQIFVQGGLYGYVVDHVNGNATVAQINAMDLAAGLIYRINDTGTINKGEPDLVLDEAGAVITCDGTKWSIVTSKIMITSTEIFLTAQWTEADGEVSVDFSSGASIVGDVIITAEANQDNTTGWSNLGKSVVWDLSTGRLKSDSPYIGTLLGSIVGNVNFAVSGLKAVDSSGDIYLPSVDLVFNRGGAEAHTTLTFSDIKEYSVTFIDHGLETVRYYPENTFLTREMCETPTGNNFNGWYLDPTFVNRYDYNMIVNDESDGLKLYARYTYVVTLDCMNGIKYTLQVSEEDSGALLTESDLPVPDYTGYTFSGWCKDYNRIYDWSYQSDRVYEDTILYARWIGDEVRIYFWFDDPETGQLKLFDGTKTGVGPTDGKYDLQQAYMLNTERKLYPTVTWGGTFDVRNPYSGDEENILSYAQSTIEFGASFVKWTVVSPTDSTKHVGIYSDTIVGTKVLKFVTDEMKQGYVDLWEYYLDPNNDGGYHRKDWVGDGRPDTMEIHLKAETTKVAIKVEMGLSKEDQKYSPTVTIDDPESFLVYPNGPNFNNPNSKFVGSFYDEFGQLYYAGMDADDTRYWVGSSAEPLYEYKNGKLVHKASAEHPEVTGQEPKFYWNADGTIRYMYSDLEGAWTCMDEQDAQSIPSRLSTAKYIHYISFPKSNYAQQYRKIANDDQYGNTVEGNNLKSVAYAKVDGKEKKFLVEWFDPNGSDYYRVKNGTAGYAKDVCWGDTSTVVYHINDNNQVLSASGELLSVKLYKNKTFTAENLYKIGDGNIDVYAQSSTVKVYYDLGGVMAYRNLEAGDTVKWARSWTISKTGTVIGTDNYTLPNDPRTQSDEGRFILLYETANPQNKYSVVMVDANGNASAVRNLSENDRVKLASGNWYISKSGTQVTPVDGNYVVTPSDGGGRGFIILYQTANPQNKYTVIKVTEEYITKSNNSYLNFMNRYTGDGGLDFYLKDEAGNPYKVTSANKSVVYVKPQVGDYHEFVFKLNNAVRNGFTLYGWHNEYISWDNAMAPSADQVRKVHLWHDTDGHVTAAKLISQDNMGHYVEVPLLVGDYIVDPKDADASGNIAVVPASSEKPANSTVTKIIEKREVGDAIALDSGTWYVNGASVGTTSYTVNASHADIEGTIIVTDVSSAYSGEYTVTLVEKDGTRSVHGVYAAGTNIDLDNPGSGRYWMTKDSQHRNLTTSYSVSSSDSDVLGNIILKNAPSTYTISDYTVKVMMHGCAPGSTVMLNNITDDPDRGFDGWIVNDRALDGSDYTLVSTDADYSRFIVLYKTANEDEKYTVFAIGDNGVTVGRNLTDNVGLVDLDKGEWHCAKTGSTVEKTINNQYKVKAADADTRGFIVLYKTANAAGEYTVVKDNGSKATALAGSGVGDLIHDVGGWHVAGRTIDNSVYTIRSADADDVGSIVLGTVWKDMKTYTVKWVDSSPSQPVHTDSNQRVGTSITVPQIESEGRVFLGWRAATGTVDDVYVVAHKDRTSNTEIVLNAVWADSTPAAHTIVRASDKGGWNAQIETGSTTVSLDETLTADGYSMTGWRITTGSNPRLVTAPSYTLDESDMDSRNTVILEAEWAKTYTVTVKGSEPVHNLISGDAVPLVYATPDTKWKVEDDIIVKGDRINDAKRTFTMKYDAIWEQIPYSVHLSQPANGVIEVYLEDRGGSSTSRLLSDEEVNSMVFYHGDKLRISYTPNNSKVAFIKWIVTNTSYLENATSASTLLVIQDDCSIAVDESTGRLVDLVISFDDDNLDPKDREYTRVFLRDPSTGEYYEASYIPGMVKMDHYVVKVPYGDGYETVVWYGWGHPAADGSCEKLPTFEDAPDEYVLVGTVDVNIYNTDAVVYDIISAGFIDTIDKPNVIADFVDTEYGAIERKYETDPKFDFLFTCDEYSVVDASQPYVKDLKKNNVVVYHIDSSNKVFDVSGNLMDIKFYTRSDCLKSSAYNVNSPPIGFNNTVYTPIIKGSNGGNIVIYEAANPKTPTPQYAVVKVWNDSPYVSVQSGLAAGDTVTGVNDWYLKGRAINGDYTVKAKDADAGGYIVIYKKANDTDKYNVVKIKSNFDVSIERNKSPKYEVTGVSGWYVKGVQITSPYLVNANDSYPGASETSLENTYSFVRTTGAGHPIRIVDDQGKVVVKITKYVGIQRSILARLAANNLNINDPDGGTPPVVVTFDPNLTYTTFEGFPWKDVSNRNVFAIESDINLAVGSDSNKNPQKTFYLNWVRTDSPADVIIQMAATAIPDHYAVADVRIVNESGGHDAIFKDVRYDLGAEESDPDAARFIVLFETPNAQETYTVIKQTALDTVSSERGLSIGSKLEVGSGWKLGKTGEDATITDGKYTVSASDADKNRFIVLYKEANGVGEYSAIKVGDGGTTVEPNLSAEATVTGVDGWHVMDRTIHGNYTVDPNPYYHVDAPLDHIAGYEPVAEVYNGGNIVVYQTANPTKPTATYTVVIVGDSTFTVERGKAAESTVSGVNGWFVKGRTIDTSYTVDAADADEGGFIVVYQTARNDGSYNVVTVPTDGDPDIKRGKQPGVSVEGVAGWYVKGRTIAPSYVVSDSATQGYVKDVKIGSTVKYRINSSNVVYDVSATPRIVEVKFYTDAACTVEYDVGSSQAATVYSSYIVDAGDAYTGGMGAGGECRVHDSDELHLKVPTTYDSRLRIMISYEKGSGWYALNDSTFRYYGNIEYDVEVIGNEAWGTVMELPTTFHTTSSNTPVTINLWVAGLPNGENVNITKDGSNRFFYTITKADAISTSNFIYSVKNTGVTGYVKEVLQDGEVEYYIDSSNLVYDADTRNPVSVKFFTSRVCTVETAYDVSKPDGAIYTSSRIIFTPLLNTDFITLTFSTYYGEFDFNNSQRVSVSVPAGGTMLEYARTMAELGSVSRFITTYSTGDWEYVYGGFYWGEAPLNLSDNVTPINTDRTYLAKWTPNESNKRMFSYTSDGNASISALRDAVTAEAIGEGEVKKFVVDTEINMAIQPKSGYVIDLDRTRGELGYTLVGTEIYLDLTTAAVPTGASHTFSSWRLWDSGSPVRASYKVTEMTDSAKNGFLVYVANWSDAAPHAGSIALIFVSDESMTVNAIYANDGATKTIPSGDWRIWNEGAVVTDSDLVAEGLQYTVDASKAVDGYIVFVKDRMVLSEYNAVFATEYGTVSRAADLEHYYMDTNGNKYFNIDVDKVYRYETDHWTEYSVANLAGHDGLFIVQFSTDAVSYKATREGQFSTATPMTYTATLNGSGVITGFRLDAEPHTAYTVTNGVIKDAQGHAVSMRLFTDPKLMDRIVDLTAAQTLKNSKVYSGVFVECDPVQGFYAAKLEGTSVQGWMSTDDTLGVGDTDWYVGSSGVNSSTKISGITATDAKDRFIVAQRGYANPEGKYTVVLVDGSSVTLHRNLSSGATVTGVDGWKVNGTLLDTNTYNVASGDADGGRFIVIHRYDNPAGKYTVVKLDDNLTYYATKGEARSGSGTSTPAAPLSYAKPVDVVETYIYTGSVHYLLTPYGSEYTSFETNILQYEITPYGSQFRDIFGTVWAKDNYGALRVVSATVWEIDPKTSKETSTTITDLAQLPAQYYLKDSFGNYYKGNYFDSNALTISRITLKVDGQLDANLWVKYINDNEYVKGLYTSSNITGEPVYLLKRNGQLVMNNAQKTPVDGTLYYYNPYSGTATDVPYYGDYTIVTTVSKYSTDTEVRINGVTYHKDGFGNLYYDWLGTPTELPGNRGYSWVFLLKDSIEIDVYMKEVSYNINFVVNGNKVKATDMNAISTVATMNSGISDARDKAEGYQIDLDSSAWYSYTTGGPVTKTDNKYTIVTSDPNANNGFILLYKTANTPGTYTVVKVDSGATTMYRGLVAGGTVDLDADTWKCKGSDVTKVNNKYTVAAGDALNGFIVLYKADPDDYTVLKVDDGHDFYGTSIRQYTVVAFDGPQSNRGMTWYTDPDYKNEYSVYGDNHVMTPGSFQTDLVMPPALVTDGHTFNDWRLFGSNTITYSAVQNVVLTGGSQHLPGDTKNFFYIIEANWTNPGSGSYKIVYASSHNGIDGGNLVYASGAVTLKSIEDEGFKGWKVWNMDGNDYHHAGGSSYTPQDSDAVTVNGSKYILMVADWGEDLTYASNVVYATEFDEAPKMESVRKYQFNATRDITLYGHTGTYVLFLHDFDDTHEPMKFELVADENYRITIPQDHYSYGNYIFAGWSAHKENGKRAYTYAPEESINISALDERVNLYPYYLSDGSDIKYYDGQMTTLKLGMDDVLRAKQSEPSTSVLAVTYSDSPIDHIDPEHPGSPKSGTHAGDYYVYYAAEIKTPLGLSSETKYGNTVEAYEFNGKASLKIMKVDAYAIAPSVYMREGDGKIIAASSPGSLEPGDMSGGNVVITSEDVVLIGLVVSDVASKKLYTSDGDKSTGMIRTEVDEPGESMTIRPLVNFTISQELVDRDYDLKYIDGSLTIYPIDSSKYEGDGYA